MNNVLLLSHEMSRTGAPVALLNMAKQLKKEGIFLTVLSPQDGAMVQDVVAEDIAVVIDSTIGGNTEWLNWASDFDLIVVNTVVPYHNIEQLKKTQIPVLWWIHDGEMSFQLGANELLPKELTDNIHVYGGGQYACDIVNHYRPAYGARNLLYNVPDIMAEGQKKLSYEIPNPAGRKIVSTIGSVDKRKGQDVFVDAIRLLDKEEREQCLFVFVGRGNDEAVYQKVQDLKNDFPDDVFLVTEVTHSEIVDVYKQSAVVICASRDDPMPVFMTECLMLSVPVICSTNTGTYALLQDGKNGLTFKSEDVEGLRDKIRFAIHNEEELKQIGKCGREVYENNFTDEAFSKALKQVIENL